MLNGEHTYALGGAKCLDTFPEDEIKTVDSQLSSLTLGQVCFFGPKRVFEISALQTAVSMVT